MLFRSDSLSPEISDFRDDERRLREPSFEPRPSDFVLRFQRRRSRRPVGPVQSHRAVACTVHRRLSEHRPRGSLRQTAGKLFTFLTDVREVAIENVEVERSPLGVHSVRNPVSAAPGTDQFATNRFESEPGESFSGGLHMHHDQEEVFCI